MKELFYFSFADVMAKVEYDAGNNELKYATQRRLAPVERVVIETYILQVIASEKTNYYTETPSNFLCLGVDLRLVAYLDHFKFGVAIKNIRVHEKKVDGAVNELIGSAMENYYGEKIGDALKDGKTGNLWELVNAYNQYAKKKIALESLQKNADAKEGEM